MLSRNWQIGDKAPVPTQHSAPSTSSKEGVPLRGLNCFRPYERLRSSAEYHKVKEVGKRARAPHFGVNFAVNGQDYHRLGLIVQKRFWCAVLRNRIKRCLREWFRTHKHDIPLPGKDIVIIARPGAEKLSTHDISRELQSVFTHQDCRSR